jgi:hypothetical protein
LEVILRVKGWPVIEKAVLTERTETELSNKVLYDEYLFLAPLTFDL